MADKIKYAAWDSRDISWDDFHRNHGVMTNREFFTSNGLGGFYEGMEWDEESQEWIPNAETRQKEREKEQNKCQGCGHEKIRCECDD